MYIPSFRTRQQCAALTALMSACCVVRQVIGRQIRLPLLAFHHHHVFAHAAVGNRAKSPRCSSHKSVSIIASANETKFSQASTIVEAIGSLIQRVARCVFDLVRAAQLSLIFLPPALLTPLAIISPGRFGGAWGRQLTRALEQAGATFTKLGQWAGTRPDLFPLRLIEPLRRLHEAVEKEPWEVTRRAIAEAIGKPDEVCVYSRPSLFSLFAGTYTLPP